MAYRKRNDVHFRFPPYMKIFVEWGVGMHVFSLSFYKVHFFPPFQFFVGCFQVYLVGTSPSDFPPLSGNLKLTKNLNGHQMSREFNWLKPSFFVFEISSSCSIFHFSDGIELEVGLGRKNPCQWEPKTWMPKIMDKIPGEMSLWSRRFSNPYLTDVLALVCPLSPQQKAYGER